MAFTKGSRYKKNLEAVNSMMHRGNPLSGKERNCVFLNRGDGSFATVSALSGYDEPDDGRGLALMDWDFDGRIDFWASSRTAPRVRFMKNQLKDTGDWLGLRLQGKGLSNRDAIGARVKVTLDSGQIIVKSVRAGEGFASQSSKWLHLGLGKKALIKAVDIRWPSGKVIKLQPPKKNAYYTMVEGDESFTDYIQPARKKLPRGSNPLPSPPAGSTVRAPLRIPIPLPAIRYKEAGVSKVTAGKPGRPLIINLWSQSCNICRGELEEFTRDQKRLQGKVDILALCVDAKAEDQRAADTFTRQINFAGVSGIPEAGAIEILAQIFTSSFPLRQNLPAPASLLVSSDGEIVALYTREISTDELLRDVADLASRSLTADQRDAAVSSLKGVWLKRPGDINLLYLPRMMMEHGRVDDAASYVRRAHSQLSKHKEYGKLLIWIGEQNMKRGNKKEAITFYNNALSVGKDKPFVLNNVAWMLATHKDADVRNGKLALQVAHRACKLTQFKEPAYLDTLAAAYAEIGDFGKAINMARHAMALAKEQKKIELIQGLQKAVELYSRNQPMR